MYLYTIKKNAWSIGQVRGVDKAFDWIKKYLKAHNLTGQWSYMKCMVNEDVFTIEKEMK